MKSETIHLCDKTGGFQENVKDYPEKEIMEALNKMVFIKYLLVLNNVFIIKL